MNRWQIFSIIALFVASIGLSATASHADEIGDLKKRLKFLEAQKEIVKKLDSMQSNIDGLRGKIDGFQKQLDDFRVQYDLKASTKETKKNVKKEVKKPQESKITAQQYVDAVLGNTVIGKTDRGTRYKYYLKKGGTQVLNLESGFYDKGTWEIKDGKLCMQWERVRQGKYYCLRDYELNGDLYTSFNEANGKRGGPYRIAKGKTAGFQDVKK